MHCLLYIISSETVLSGWRDGKPLVKHHLWVIFFLDLLQSRVVVSKHALRLILGRHTIRLDDGNFGIKICSNISATAQLGKLIMEN